jgi:hypothetical protein
MLALGEGGPKLSYERHWCSMRRRKGGFKLRDAVSIDDPFTFGFPTFIDFVARTVILISGPVFSEYQTLQLIIP